jgi:hypothetical protein
MNNTEKPQKINARNTKSANVRQYLISEMLTKQPVDGDGFNFYASTVEQYRMWLNPGRNLDSAIPSVVTKKGLETVVALLQIAGVVSIRVRTYEIHITRSLAHEWGPMHIQAVSILKEYLFDSNFPVKVEDNFSQSVKAVTYTPGSAYLSVEEEDAYGRVTTSSHCPASYIRSNYGLPHYDSTVDHLNLVPGVAYIEISFLDGDAGGPKRHRPEPRFETVEHFLRRIGSDKLPDDVKVLAIAANSSSRVAYLVRVPQIRGLDLDQQQMLIAAGFNPIASWQVKQPW